MTAIDDLEKLARSATPGPWVVNKYGSIGIGETGTKCAIAHVEALYGKDAEFGDHHTNRAFIAAMHPAFALKLFAMWRAADRVTDLQRPFAEVAGDMAALRKALEELERT